MATANSTFETRLGLAPLAPFWPLGAFFFRLAVFVEEACSGASCAPCAATVAAVSVVSVLVMLRVPFRASFAHDNSSLGLPGKASEMLTNSALNV